MIHEVRLPPETKIYLWQITCLQMDVLECVAVLPPGSLSQQTLREVLEPKMHGRAARVAKWIYSHKEVKEGLEEFVKGSQADKQALVAAMERDVLRLFRGKRDETLECRFGPDKNLQPYKGAKQFLIAFYKQLSNGINTDVFAWNPFGYSKYGRKQFFAAYERANPHQLVCAICDEHRPITMLQNSYLSDIEHYFPKSIYPHLACHPYNLIPICRACNAVHSEKDPLAPTNGSKRRTLGEVFLPYRQDSVRLQGAIKLDWASSPSPQLEFTNRSTNTPSAFSAKIQAFSEIYDIPGRWQRRIHSIGEQLWRHISAFVRVTMDKGESINPSKIKTALERLLDYFVADLGATPWDFILTWYLSYLLIAEIEAALQNQQMKAKELPLVETIEDILKHTTSKEHRILNSDSILKASRKLYGNDTPS